jgi:hypothetical protein
MKVKGIVQEGQGRFEDFWGLEAGKAMSRCTPPPGVFRKFVQAKELEEGVWEIIVDKGVSVEFSETE